MSDLGVDIRRQARERAYTIPLEEIDMADPELFRTDAIWPYFERLRAEDPIHWAETDIEDIGGYWSITKYEDIISVDTNHEVFSAEPMIVLKDPEEQYRAAAFIAMDPPKHGLYRNAVGPVMAGPNLVRMAPVIRERAGRILDDLPIGEPFNWVEKVSIELTTMTLATLFDFPWEDRRKLTRWSDFAFAPPGSKLYSSTDPEVVERERRAVMDECEAYFMRLWSERVNAEPTGDLVSMLAHNPTTRYMSPQEYLANIILLIVGGNDTTRNSISGSVYALSENPEQERILRENPALVPAMVSEAIRWQTPIAYFRRTAKQDFELGGKQMRKGDKVAMWYVSGNRDEDVMERPNDFWIERPNVRRHLSFGFGIHRCVGSRLAELQLKIIWEEILERFPKIEVIGPPERVYSSFIHGFESLPAVIPTRN